LAVVIAASLAVLGPGAASAVESGYLNEAAEDGSTIVESTVTSLTGSATGGTTGDSAQTSGSTSETADVVPAPEAAPKQSAQQAAGETDRSGSWAEAQAAKIAIGGNDVVDVARSAASIDDNDDSHADATLLALGGEEILGAHADSDGEKESHAGDPLAPLCEGSEGQICLRVLFADAYASEDGTTSQSLAQSGVADLCLGGDSADPRADCSGPVSAKIATSEAQMRRDKTDGSTEGSAESAIADVCVGAEGETCAVGVEVLKARSFARSDGTTDGESTVAALELGNEEVGSISDPAKLEIQPDCAAPSLVCVTVNQGASAVNEGVASQTQDALNAGILPDTLNVDTGLSNTGVTATQGDAVAGIEEERPDAAGAGGPGGPGAGGPGNPGTGEVAGVEKTALLPNTGGFWSGLLAIALGAIAAGSFLLARNRRRLGTPA
jgi:LPXTG-motif cell wall-anchored protein